MKINLDIIKNYLKIDSDEDDELISIMIEAAEEYIEEKIDKVLDSEKAMSKIMVAMLVTHWYENRGVEIGSSNKKIDHAIDNLIFSMKWGS